MSTSSNPLSEDIIREAQEKAEKILSDARANAELIKSHAEDKAKAEILDEKKTFDARMSLIRDREDSEKRNIDRMIELKSMNSSYQYVLSGIYKEFEKKAGTDGFKDILVSWMVEASIGLNKNKALVSYSALAPVDEKMLKKAEAEVERITGNKIELSLDNTRCQSLGVVLTSTDALTSFDNTLDERIKRYQREIRKIIQDKNAK